MILRTMLRTFLLIGAALVFASSAVAQPRAMDLWVPLVDETAEVDRALVEQVFAEVLASAPDTVHIVGVQGIEDAIGRSGFALPRCFEGVDVCTTPVEAVVRALGADRVLYALAREGGTVIELTVLDVELDRTTTYEVRAPNLRQAVFAAIGAVTDASGTLSLGSEPQGARIFLDNTLIGVTPYESTLGVGSYYLRLELDGYFSFGTHIEVRAGDFREQTIALERRYADVTIACAAPGAEVVVDGDHVYPVGEPMHLDPGTRQVRVRAPGHDSDERVLELIAGESRSYDVALVESAETIARRQYETILARPFVVRLGAAGALYAGDWAGASGDGVTVGCDSSATGACTEQESSGTLGVAFDLLYDWRWAEVGLVGIGYHRLGLRNSPSLSLTDGRTADDARHGRSLSVTLPSVGGRWQIDERLAVAGRTGARLQFDRVGAAVEDDDVQLSRTYTTWELSAECRYHLSARLFGFAELSAGFPLGGGADRARLGGQLGVGFNLDDPFGLDDALDDRFRRRDDADADAPSEL